jgi:hypothetical protein
MSRDLERLGRRLVGAWTSTATHPALAETVIAGSCEFEWLDGERFLVFRTHYDHADIPDALAIIGDVDGPQMHYFDSRGVHRVYAVTVTNDGWTIEMNRGADARAFASSDAPFSQRVIYTFGDADATMSGRGQLSYDDTTWNDDLAITYRRA